MIISNKNAPLSFGADSGAVKITQDDCITISREEYDIYVGNCILLDRVKTILSDDNRPEFSRFAMVRYLLDIPEEVPS